VDGGVDPDAGAPPDAGTTTELTVDFQSALFPPLVNKIGYNSFWNAAGNDNNVDAWTIARAARHRAPMIAGLLETKSLLQGNFYPDGSFYTDRFEEYGDGRTAAQLDLESPTLWLQQSNYSETLFYRDTNNNVVARSPSDADLVGLLAGARGLGLSVLLQLAGTPGTAYPYATTRNNGLFDLVGTATTGGNWYPLPAQNEYPTLAQTFGTLPAALGAQAGLTYAFWQEPTHTLSESINAATSVDRYSEFYALTAQAMVAGCPQWMACELAGAQLNANDGDDPVHDGYRYAWFVDALRAAEAAPGGQPIPLDVFTVQNYAAQWNENIIPNTRAALAADYNWTPVVMNEWDYCVNTRPGGDLCGNGWQRFGERYEATEAWAVLHWLWDSIRHPDVSRVLVRELVFQRAESPGVYVYPWVQVPIVFMGAMSEMRRTVTPEVPGLTVLASGDPDQLTMMAWNEGATPQSIRFNLTRIPGRLRNNVPLAIKRMSAAVKAARCPNADVMDANHNITCWEDAAPALILTGANAVTPDVLVNPGDAVMLFAGSPPPYTSALQANDNVVRSRVYVPRNGTASPTGMGHFDPRTSSLTVAAQPGGSGVARVLLTNAPNTLDVTTRLAPATGANGLDTVGGVRVDYFNGAHAVVKTVFFRDGSFGGGTVDWNAWGWPAAATVSEVVTAFCPLPCGNGSGDTVVLDIQGQAPLEWSATREIEVAAILTSPAVDAIYRVALP
jgi:hypothetical protein